MREETQEARMPSSHANKASVVSISLLETQIPLSHAVSPAFINLHSTGSGDFPLFLPLWLSPRTIQPVYHDWFPIRDTTSAPRQERDVVHTSYPNWPRPHSVMKGTTLPWSSCHLALWIAEVYRPVLLKLGWIAWGSGEKAKSNSVGLR